MEEVLKQNASLLHKDASTPRDSLAYFTTPSLEGLTLSDRAVAALRWAEEKFERKGSKVLSVATLGLEDRLLFNRKEMLQIRGRKIN